MSGQLFLSKPGAFSKNLLSAFSTNASVWGSNRREFQGTANSLSPSPKKPPKDRTAYATRPRAESIITSSTFPRLSPSGLVTFRPTTSLLDLTIGEDLAIRGSTIIQGLLSGFLAELISYYSELRLPGYRANHLNR